MTTLTLILVFAVQGPLTINSGNGDDVISISQTSGDISLTSGAGTHSVTIEDTVGGIDINIGNGDDQIYIFDTEGAINITSGDGFHNATFDLTVGSIDMTVGSGSSHLFTITDTVGSITLVTGNGDHRAEIEDTSNGDISITTGQNSEIGFFYIRDTSNGDVSIMSAGGPSNDVTILNTEDGSSSNGDVSVIIGPGPCILSIVYTSGDIYIDLHGSGDDFVDLLEIGGSINVKTWDDDDVITVDKLYGSLFIDSGANDDVVYIDYLGGNGTVLGGTGDDSLLLDARGDPDDPVNTMAGSHIDWDGGGGDDTLELYFVSTDSTTLNMVGDNMDVNQVIARCSDVACTMLSRRTFLANIHDPGNSDSSLERINLGEGQSITTLLLYLNGGENAVHFDDTMCIMDVFGGDDKVSTSLLSCCYFDVSNRCSPHVLMVTYRTHFTLVRCIMMAVLLHMAFLHRTQSLPPSQPKGI
jgi:hypothetical protein